MRRYVYTDYDDYDNEYDIIGDDYKILINYCFKYASCFSLDFFGNQTRNVTFSFERINTLPVMHSENVNLENNITRKYFKCTEEAYLILIQDFGNIFEYMWEKAGSPENLTFYRNDDSVILAVNTHEGYCDFYPLPHENPSEILKFGHWIEYQKGMYF